MAVTRRAVVVGLGSIGRRHARLLDERADIELELCDPSLESIALVESELGPRRVHSSYSEMLDTQPDIVVVATPHHLHVGQVKAAMEAGLSVLCEKPVSDDLDAARSLIGVDRATPGLLCFGFHLHFHPAIRSMLDIVRAGGIGTPAQFNAHVGSLVTLVNSASRYQAEMRGALLLDYTHQADLAQLMFGTRPTGVYARGTDIPGMALSSSPNVISMIVDFGESQTSTIHLNYLQDPDREDCEIVGTEGWIRYDAKQGEWRRGRTGAADVEKRQIRPQRDDIYRDEHQAFIKALDGVVAVESPLEEAISSLAIARGALLSMESRAYVTL